MNERLVEKLNEIFIRKALNIFKKEKKEKEEKEEKEKK
jgi:hypothetical protein